MTQIGSIGKTGFEYGFNIVVIGSTRVLIEWIWVESSEMKGFRE